MTSRGLFYARLEDRDWNFLRGLGERAPFDAAIIRANYLAPYPSEDHRFGESPDRLVGALAKREWAWALDPNTAPHAHPKAAEWAAPRAQNCSLAQVTPLPWGPMRFDDPGLVAELVDRAVDLQRLAGGLAVPYFELKRPEDPELAVNCSLISLIAERAGDQRVITYLQTLGSRLVDGSAEESAKRYVDAGAETILIRIRRFQPHNLEQVLAYLKLVERIEASGARAVADSTGHFGPVAVAAGADAFSAGARFFRKVPDALLSKPSERAEDEDEESESGGGPPMLYEHPGQLASVHPNAAGSHLASCGEPDCQAQDGKGEPRYIREHNLHEFRSLSRKAAREGLRFASTLRDIGSPEALLWAAALDQRATQRRAA